MANVVDWSLDPGSLRKELLQLSKQKLIRACMYHKIGYKDDIQYTVTRLLTANKTKHNQPSKQLKTFKTNTKYKHYISKIIIKSLTNTQSDSHTDITNVIFSFIFNPNKIYISFGLLNENNQISIYSPSYNNQKQSYSTPKTTTTKSDAIKLLNQTVAQYYILQSRNDYYTSDSRGKLLAHFEDNNISDIDSHLEFFSSWENKYLKFDDNFPLNKVIKIEYDDEQDEQFNTETLTEIYKIIRYCHIYKRPPTSIITDNGDCLDDIAQLIDFNGYENLIFHRNKNKKIKLKQLIYSKTGGHVWFIYDNREWSFQPYENMHPFIYYTKLIYNPAKCGEIYFQLPLIEVNMNGINDMKQFYQSYHNKMCFRSHFRCTANGSLICFNLDEYSFINISDIKMDSKTKTVEGIQLTDSKSVQWKRYKLNDWNDNYYKDVPFIHNGNELNVLFCVQMFDGNKNYLCYFNSNKFIVQISDLYNGKMVYEYVEMNKIEKPKEDVVGYKFDCVNSRMLMLFKKKYDSEHAWMETKLLGTYFDMRLNKMDDLNLICSIYAEGGYAVDCIEESMDGMSFYIWCHVNTRGSGNESKYWQINAENFQLLNKYTKLSFNPIQIDQKMNVILPK